MTKRPLVCSLVIAAALWVGCGDGGPGETGAGGGAGSQGGAAATADSDLPAPMSVAEIVAAIESRRGKPLLVNYWATWCSPCVAEMPDFLEAGADFEKRGGQILIVSLDLLNPGATLDGLPRKVSDLMDKRGWQVDCLVWDGDAKTSEIAAALGPVTALPVTTAYSATGAKVEAHEGEGTLELFREMAERAARAD